ncbi:MAG: hypothetical protein HYZ34_14255 [Ignavibacteriae bacterium]|nr:hypothetical protein [Ignavibacteriota bacterium]
MKLSNILILSILFYFSFLSAISQTLSQEERQKVIDSLSSFDIGTRLSAIQKIEEYNILEALPVIEQKIWLQDEPTLKIEFLTVMQQFGSLNVQETAHLIIDSAGYYSQNQLRFDSLRLQVRVTVLLFNIGDYSTTSYVFKILHRDSTYIDFYALLLLKEIVLNIPEYAESAKTELLRISKEAHSSLLRSMARNFLFELFGQNQDVINYMVYIATNDSNSTSRITAIHNLFKINYPQLHDLLVERLYNEPEAIWRSQIAESLLIHYGTLADYDFVLNYLSHETENLAVKIINRSLIGFRPPQPDSGTTIAAMIDSLVSLKHQVAAYGWLGSQNFIDELDNDLDSAKIYIQQGDSLSCRRLIKIFQQKVDEEYNDSLDGDTREVKMGGWQFLYWNAEYILNRLPDIPSMYRKEE